MTHEDDVAKKMQEKAARMKAEQTLRDQLQQLEDRSEPSVLEDIVNTVGLSAIVVGILTLAIYILKGA